MNYGGRRRGASGAVLLLMLMLIVLLALAGGWGLRSSAVDLRVAAGLVLRDELRLWAEAAVDAAIRSPANFPLDATVGDVLCGGDVLGADCGGAMSGVADLIGAPPAGMRLWYRAQRRAPLVTAGARIRAPARGGAAVIDVDAARLEVTATADGSALGLGRVTLVRGIGVAVGGPAVPGTVFHAYWRESMADDL